MAERWQESRCPDLVGRHVLLVGLGISGLAAARLLVHHGARVTATDDRPVVKLDAATRELTPLGIPLRCNAQPDTLVDSAELVVVSPGVPSTHRLLIAAQQREIPVWGEVELAGRFCVGKIIGITGSNGKSTVTATVGEILRLCGIPGGTGGNLGTPFADLLQHDSPEAVHAVELSSFQLETVELLHPHGAALLNLTPDHLDRYPSFEAYREAKARLFELQSPSDFALINADDPESQALTHRVRGRLLQFSTLGEVEHGGFVRNDVLTLRTEFGEESLCHRDMLPLPGEHNVQNALAAAVCCRMLGCEPAAIVAGLRSFEGLPHRMQHVGTIRGIKLYNDSKATNPTSAARAVQGFPAGSVHWILGGRAKGGDWSELTPGAQQVKRILLVGEAAGSIRAELESFAPCIDCETIPRAVATALADGVPGDVVLLSPACTSFDQYDNFEARGVHFHKIVRELIQDNTTGDSDA